MHNSLQKLTKLMPPLKGQRHTQVDWPLLEEHLGIRYPQSFKDFIGIYGSSHWFEKVLPIYGMPKTPGDVQEFCQQIADNLQWLKGNQYDENYKESHLPLYPEPGGLFPFLNDIDGPLYCWLTAGEDPERWPVCCWLRGPIVTLKDMSIADMFVGFLERSPAMMQVWGDVNELEPHRLAIVDCCSD